MENHYEERHELLDELERHQAYADVPLTPALPKKSEGSTAFLDGLRGLAALSVFIQHYIGGFDANAHEHGFGEKGKYYYIASFPFLRLVFSGGSAAVAIFFVLSGYVLSKSPLRLLRNGGGKRYPSIMSLVSATVRRPMRLYMPPLGVTFTFALLLHAPFGIMPEQLWPQPQKTLAAEIANWFFECAKFFNPFRTHGSNQAWFPYSLVVWTIPIELKGSILIYGLTAVYVLIGSSRSLTLTMALLTISVVGLLQSGYWTMACFIAGLVLSFVDVYALDTSLLFHRFTQRAQSTIWHVAILAGLYLLSQPAHAGHPAYSLDTPGWHTLTLLTPSAYDKDQYYRYWHSWGAWLLVYSTLRIQWLQTFLNTRPLRYLGKVSFMLYLIHLPILAILGGRVARIFGNAPQDPSEKAWYDNLLYIPDFGPSGPSSRFIASVAVLLPVCLALSHLGTKVLDEPSVRIGKRLVQKLGLDRRLSSPGDGRRKEETEGGSALPEHYLYSSTDGGQRPVGLD